MDPHRASVLTQYLLMNPSPGEALNLLTSNNVHFYHFCHSEFSVKLFLLNFSHIVDPVIHKLDMHHLRTNPIRNDQKPFRDPYHLAAMSQSILETLHTFRKWATTHECIVQCYETGRMKMEVWIVGDPAAELHNPNPVCLDASVYSY